MKNIVFITSNDSYLNIYQQHHFVWCYAGK